MSIAAALMLFAQMDAADEDEAITAKNRAKDLLMASGLSFRWIADRLEQQQLWIPPRIVTAIKLMDRVGPEADYAVFRGIKRLLDRNNLGFGHIGKLLAVEQRLLEIVQHARAAEERATAAEEQTKAADDRARESEQDATETQAWARRAEDRANAAEQERDRAAERHARALQEACEKLANAERELAILKRACTDYESTLRDRERIISNQERTVARSKQRNGLLIASLAAICFVALPPVLWTPPAPSRPVLIPAFEAIAATAITQAMAHVMDKVALSDGRQHEPSKIIPPDTMDSHKRHMTRKEGCRRCESITADVWNEPVWHGARCWGGVGACNWGQVW